MRDWLSFSQIGVARLLLRRLKKEMKIRIFNQGEEQILWSLLCGTVHKVNRKDYSQAQIEARAPSEWDFSQWKRRSEKTNPFAAEENGQLTGFAELEKNGHIDCFYCADNWQGNGAGGALLNVIELEASKQSFTGLFAEAGITAKGFFERKGFSVQRPKKVLSSSD